MRFLKKNFLSVFVLIVLFASLLATATFKWKSIYKDYSDNTKNSKSIKEYLEGFESSVTENWYGKNAWIELLGVFNTAIGKKIVVDNNDRYTVYKLNNGQLSWNYHGYSMKKNAKRYIKFAETISENNIPLLFVQVPFKIDKYNNNLPYGLEDTTNQYADSFISSISEAGCDYFDLRDVIHDEQLDYASLFYNTDHHWTAQTGFWASKVIADEAIRRYNINLDEKYLGLSNYTVEEYSDFMMGSQGKRVGRLYGGLDNFSVILPKYETNYSLSIPAINVEKTGAYEDTLFIKKNLSDNIYSGDPGRVYTGDNYAFMHIENNLSENETSVLLIKDSFSKSVIPSFASACRNLYVIDMRSYKESVVDFATSNDIDIILVVYNPSTIVNSEFYNIK